MTNNRVQSLAKAAVFVLLAANSGCNGNYNFDSPASTLTAAQLNPGAAHASASLSIRRADGTTVYSQTNRETSLTLARGQVYQACFTSSDKGTNVVLKLEDRVVASGESNSCRDFDLRTATPGNFNLTVHASGTGLLDSDQKFKVAITCSQAEAAGLSATQFVNGMSVAPAAAFNFYRFQPAGPRLADADCALDVNGDGVIDTEFTSCTQSIVAFSNHVGARTMTIHARERTCNVTLPQDRSVNLAWTMPTDPNFLQSTVASVTAAAGRERSLNLQHLSTNTNGTIAVTCGFQNGTWTIKAYHGYGERAGMAQHGMEMNFSGLTGTVDGQNVATTASTKLSQFRFATDFAVDANKAIAFSGSDVECQGSITVTNLITAGAPCSGDPANTVDRKTLLVRGKFGCSNLVGNDGVSRINVGSSRSAMGGTFACFYNQVDDCSGGGGGGGIPPLPF